jgi:hypothetical protein
MISYLTTFGGELKKLKIEASTSSAHTVMSISMLMSMLHETSFMFTTPVPFWRDNGHMSRIVQITMNGCVT